VINGTAQDRSPVFDATALAVASLTGGLVLWAYSVLTLQEPFFAVAHFVLLLPFFALASGIVALALVLPAWWLLRASRFASSGSFGLLVGVGAALLSLAWLPFAKLPLREFAMGSTFFAVWLSIMGASYVHILAVRPNPSVKGTSCGKPQAAPYVER